MNPTEIAIVRAHLNSHLVDCRDKSTQVLKRLERVEEALFTLTRTIESSARRVHRRIDRIAYSTGATLFGLLLSVIGYLIVYRTPWQL